MIRFRNPKKAVSSHDIPGGFLEDLRRDPTCRNEIESGHGNSWSFNFPGASWRPLHGRVVVHVKDALV